MSKRAKVSYLCLAALAGIALASFQRGQIFIVTSCLFLGIIFYIFGRYFFIIVSIVVAISLLWFFVFVRSHSPKIPQNEGNEILVEGVISTLSQEGINTEATLVAKTIENKKTRTTLNLKNNPLENLQVGDTVKISGNFVPPSESNSRYYFTKNISGDLYVSEVHFVKRTFAGHIQNALWKLHEFCLQKLTSVFSPPVDAMLGALLLGARTDVPKEITNAFKTTGTTHILALSGYNISIIFTTFELFLAKLLKPKIRFLIAAMCIVTFVILVGPSSSIVRAAVMGILTGLAIRNNRLASGVTFLLFASTVMVLFNPKILVFDVSFQLSALATFGIMAFQKVVEQKLHFIPNFFQVREILSTTISAQIPTTPILIYTFHSLSTISLLANILVLPLVPLIMAAGFANLLISFLSLPLAKLFAPVASALVNLMDGTLLFLSRWHLSLLQMRIPVSVLILYSIFVVAAFIYLETNKHENKISR